MKKFIFMFAALAASSLAFAAVDPNHSETGGYGHIVTTGPKATVWWAEGVYKVMKDAPVPAAVEKTVSLECAGNEWESFIICIDPSKDIKGLDFKFKPFKKAGGGKLDLRSEIRKVEYVNVSIPTDDYGKAGLWPDPMPIFEKEDLSAEGGLQPYWFSIKLPKDTPAGDYTSTLVVKSLGLKIPVKLHVWDFSLPDSPSLKSLFGFGMSGFAAYDHLNTDEQIDEMFEKHMAAFRDFKMSPYNPFERTPMKTTVSGVDWKGGSFDSNVKHSGTYSYRVEDRSRTSLNEGITAATYPVGNGGKLKVKFWARGAEAGPLFAAGIECYAADGSLVTYGARMSNFNVDKEWKEYSFETEALAEGSETFEFHISPCKRTLQGEYEGTVWFDDISVTDADGTELLPCGNFEPDLDKIDIELDFSAMVPAVKKYFGEYGFTAFCQPVMGLGGGSFYSRYAGNFDGFVQGTPEYEKLFEKYMISLDKGLTDLGIVDKANVYWFDEPGAADYEFIHETNARIKKYSPHIRPFLTENIEGQDISDVTDCSCTIWHLLNHEKIQAMKAKGMENWSYLCCLPKAPWISEFIDHDAINMRMWCIASYKYDLAGILIWATNYWNSDIASPAGRLHNPWEDGMCWTTGYGFAYRELYRWGNGDGRFFYPLNRDPNDGSTEPHLGEPVPSIRLQFLRDGIEDYEYFKIYEKLSGKKVEIPETLFTDEKTYDKNPADALAFRKQIAEAIEALKK